MQVNHLIETHGRRRIFDLRRSQRAVFAVHDAAAIGTRRVLKMGVRLVPQDIAVVSFDNVPFTRYISPALTTIRAPIEEVRREALRQLNGRTPDPLNRLPTELIIHASADAQPQP